MSLDPRPQNPLSVHVPIAILAIAFSLYLFAQRSASSAQQDFLRFQMSNIDKRQKQLVDAEKQLKEAYTQREPAVKQSTEIQAKFQSLFSDLLELSKEDADARKIVEDWKIQKPAPPAQQPAADAAAPADAPK